ncbi:MAG: glycosyltransferase family A protein [Anaerolineae bacterium]|nr:glycosyltransferase family A protein [Anaerolineae bacterium]
MTALSIVFGFRDRDIKRVERCLASLSQQSFTDFEVLFVDYGSQAQTAQAVRHIIEKHRFARYIYTETRGYPWNRSHALNIGGKRARGDYLMTTDVDMIYPPDFLDVFMAQAEENLEVHIAPHLLPENFSDWANINAYRGKFETGTTSMRGACQMIATRVFHEMRGYDEYYRYYGVEDRDMSIRLRLMGIEEKWLADKTAMFHQWHPSADYNVRDLIPEGVWGRMEIHFQKQRHQLIRNDDSWGKLHSHENRPALRFVDADNQTLRNCPELHHVNLPPTENYAIGTVSKLLREVKSGDALAINHAFFPKPNPNADKVIKFVNRFFYRWVQGSRIDYPTNSLHNFLVNLIEAPTPLIADYYLNLPVKNGVSIIVKA